MGTFEPRTTRPSRLKMTFRLPEIYPGVKGFAMRHGTEIWIPMIWGNGTGQVGKFLDNLSPRCRIVNVVNSKLRGMLRRRRFKRTWAEDGFTDVWAPRQK